MRWLFLLPCALALQAQTGQQVLLVVNGSDPVSRELGDYYKARRAVPAKNVCALETRAGEQIEWQIYEAQIERPIADCLRKNGLQEQILYIALSMGIPLKIQGAGSQWTAEYASVDSELTLLYGKMKGATFGRQGVVPNPFYMHRDAPFTHPRFPIYLVTRLAAYNLAEAKGMIDRSLAAHNRGKFVIDAGGPNGAGNQWLLTAAMLLPADRVIQDATATVLYGQKDVIGYASWGSNDANRKQRRLGFEWLPGAIAAEFVSSSLRTLKRPPDNWNITTYEDREHFFAGSPQGLSTDLIEDGATGASGNVYEPLLAGTVRPDYLLPAYYQGRNLAESYYVAMPFLSWQGVVLGDPLCSLGKP